MVRKKKDIIDWWTNQKFRYKIVAILLGGIILDIIFFRNFTLHILLWASSTIAQSMAALLGIVAIFVIFQFEIIKREISDYLNELNQILAEIFHEPVLVFEKLEPLRSGKERQDFIDSKKNISKEIKYPRDQYSRKQVEYIIDQITILSIDKKGQIKNFFKICFWLIGTTIIFALLLVTVGSTDLVLCLGFLLSLAFYSLFSMSFTLFSIIRRA